MKIAFIQKIKQLAAALAAYFAAKPAAEPIRCNNIKSLVHHLCDFDDTKAQWLLRWLAYPLRNPGAKMATGVLVYGEQGTGKSLLFERVMARIYEHGAIVIGPSQLGARFNAWADHRRFVVVDGTLSQRQSVDAKHLISSRSIVIQFKFEEPREQYSRMNFAFLASDINPLPDHQADRRIFRLDAPPAMSNECYRAIAYEIEHGGVDAFADYLMRGLDMGDFDQNSLPPAAYQTAAA